MATPHEQTGNSDLKQLPEEVKEKIIALFLANKFIEARQHYEDYLKTHHQYHAEE